MSILTVNQLIDALQKFNSDTPVYFANSDGTVLLGVYEVQQERDENGPYVVLFSDESE